MRIYWFFSGLVLFLPHVVCCLFLPKRSKWLLRIIPGFSFLVLVSYLFPEVKDMHNYYWILHVLACLFLAFSSDLSVQLILYYNIWAISFYYLNQALSALIASVIKPYEMIDVMFRSKFLTIFFVLLLEAVLMKLIQKKPTHELKGSQIFLSALISGAVVVMNNVTYHYIGAGNFLIFLFQVFSLLTVLLALYMLLQTIENQKKEEESNLMQHLWNLHKNDYEMKKEYIDLINQKYHDIKHELRALQLVNIQEKNEKINILRNNISGYEKLIYSGNPVIDTILNQQILQCERCGVLLQCVIYCEDLAFFDIVDLNVLLCNLIDNAREAVSKLEDAKKYIELKMRETSGFFRIMVRNPYEGMLELKDGIPVSKKGDFLYHGFGIRSVKKVVGKYQGEFVIDLKDQIFQVSILIPIPAEDGTDRLSRR